MKKILMSTIVAGTLAIAGGDISPVVQVAPDDSGFYAGMAAGAGQTFKTSDWNYFDEGNGNDVYAMLGIFAGYRYSINPEWFVDGQLGVYTTAGSVDIVDRTDVDISIRPGYRITPEWDVYGILAETYTRIEGYGSDWTTGVGIGVGYDINKDVKATVEYQYQIQDWNGYAEVKNDKIMVGLRYTF
jgi:predicted porin